MWITPSGIPRYNLHEEDLVKVNLETGKTLGRLKPSIEWYMHVSIYKKLEKANAIVHTHSPYTLGIAISVIDKFQHIIEEAKIVVGICINIKQAIGFSRPSKSRFRSI